MKSTSKLSLIGVIGAIIASTSQVLAAPAAEPKCTRVVRQPANPSSVMFNEDCTIGYVVPPTNGVARASAVSTNTNINFCPAVNRVGTISAKTMEAADKIATKILTMIDDFDPLDAQIAALSSHMAEAQTALAAADATVAADLTRKAELMSAFAAAKSTYDDCALINGPDLCTDAFTAMTAAKQELTTFVTTVLGPNQKAAIAARATFDGLAAEYASKTTQLATALQPLFALQDQLVSLTNSVEQSYSRYTAMTGITAQLTYSIPWDELLEDYQAANPEITFQRMPIVDATFTGAVNPVLQGAGGQIPVVLGYSIPGAPSSGPASFPRGEGAVPHLGAGAASPDQSSVYFGSSVSAQLVLSLLGSCKYYPNGEASGPVGNVNDLTADMVANMNYRYEVTARRGYTARYNLAQFMTRLERLTKSGGFFSSTTIRNIQEAGNSSDWFSISFDQTAGGFAYTDMEKANITEEVKGQLIERALQLIAVQNGALPGPARLPPLQPTGAGVAAAYLMRGCGFWSWCSVGGWVLGTLDSIFGSQQAVANFKRTNNVWITDTVSDKTVLTWTGGLTFTQ